MNIRQANNNKCFALIHEIIIEFFTMHKFYQADL